MEGGEDRRQRALALLESSHAFPGAFEFRVVVRPEAKPGALSAVIAVAGGQQALIDVSERASCNLTYLSLRVRVHLPSAEAVLDTYEVLRGVDGVITIL